MKQTNAFDVLLVHSKGWETWFYGPYKEAVLVVKVVTPTREVKSVMRLTKSGWSITEELHTFLQKGSTTKVRIPFSNSHEECHLALVQLLGNKGFDGKKYTSFNGIGRLFSLPNWKNIGPRDLAKYANVEISD